MARASLLFAGAWVWAEAVTPAAAEPLALRWVRVALSHPVRTVLALLLLDLSRTAGSSAESGRFRPEKPAPTRGEERPKLG